MKKLILCLTLTLSIFTLNGCGGSDSSTSSKEVKSSVNSESANASSTDDITTKVKSIIVDSTSQSRVSITEVTVNENLVTDDENDLIVLVDLSFDVKNLAKTAKTMLNLLSNEIGANMADLDNVSELTIFWAVPYLNESGTNVAKVHLLRNDKGLYFDEEWYDPNIFE